MRGQLQLEPMDKINRECGLWDRAGQGSKCTKCVIIECNYSSQNKDRCHLCTKGHCRRYDVIGVEKTQVIWSS